MYQGRPQGVSGLNAVVSSPAEEWGRDPAGFAEMRPGVYDVHERVRDMNRNGILASMCFPTFTGFSARHLDMHREEVTLVMVFGLQRLAHRRVGGLLPGSLHPDRGAADMEPRGHVRRDPPGGGQGLPAVTMPELPHLEGLPSYHDESLGPGLPDLVRGERRDVSAHRHRVRRHQHRARRADRQSHHSGHADFGDVRPGSVVGPAMRDYPDLKFAFSEGGIGSIPFYLDRSDRHYTNQKVACATRPTSCPATCSGSTRWPAM